MSETGTKEKNKYKENRGDNISSMFRSTAIIMIVSELTGVIAVLIDGIITSQGLGIDAYSGISLFRPFTSVVFMLAGFFSTGCNIVCSKLVGCGKKKEANEAFNLSSLLAFLVAILLVVLCLCLPEGILSICGVDLTKYPELNQHLYGYMQGYIIGVPAMILIQVFGPILVMDSGKKLFTISSILLCVVDIAGDLLNVYVFHWGAFGMGLATAVAFIVQVLVLIIHFIKRSSYFRFSLKACRLRSLKEIAKHGSPALVKKLAGTLRDILVNYINIMVAISAVAITARGIQSDLFQFLFCIPTGLGRTLITMVGIYHSANDLQGLKRLRSYSTTFGVSLSGAAAVIAFILAPVLAGLYTSDPEVLSLAVFSIRWMSVALIFDTLIVLVQHYLQGIGSFLHANILSICERFAVPTACALIMGLIFGSEGILASVAVSKMILFIIIILINIFHFRGIPKDLTQAMFLQTDFGGTQSENMYEKIRTREDAIRVSQQTRQFCLDNHTTEKEAIYTSLFVEEMAVNVLDHAEKKQIKKVCIDFRLFVSEGTIYFNLIDLSEQFDPTLFYELHKEDKSHIGIRMVTKLAREVRYVSTFKNNNLTVYG